MNRYGGRRVLAEGRLDWSRGERMTDRYGSVNIQTHGRHPVSAVETSGELTVVHATFHDAPIGAMGRLLVRVLATRNSYHVGDLDRGIRTSQPSVGEVVILGEGELFVGTEDYGDVPVNSIGVRPEDGRETDWMDPHSLYRVHDQTVELSFEPKMS